MSLSLLKLADHEGIKVEYFDFAPPVNGLYWAEEGLPPVIGLDRSLSSNTPLLRCVLAEELGHHFTTVGDRIPKTYYSQSDRLLVSKAEYKALRWAAIYLMPRPELYNAFDNGIISTWELADYFNVTEDMVRFRCQLLPNC